MIVDMCSKFMVFLYGDNAIVDMCTNFMFFFRMRMRLQTCVLI